MIRINLTGRIPSKKNSKVWTGRILVSSKEYRAWEISKKKELQEQGVQKLNLDKPLYVTYKIRFPDKRRTDISNKIESINDLLVSYGLLADDNHEIINTINASSMGVDKDNPRCEIQIYLFNSME